MNNHRAVLTYGVSSLQGHSPTDSGMLSEVCNPQWTPAGGGTSTEGLRSYPAVALLAPAAWSHCEH